MKKLPEVEVSWVRGRVIAWDSCLFDGQAGAGGKSLIRDYEEQVAVHCPVHLKCSKKCGIGIKETVKMIRWLLLVDKRHGHDGRGARIMGSAFLCILSSWLLLLLFPVLRLVITTWWWRWRWIRRIVRYDSIRRRSKSPWATWTLKTISFQLSELSAQSSSVSVGTNKLLGNLLLSVRVKKLNHK